MLNNQEIPTIPILIQDLGMMFPTEKSAKKFRYGIFKCLCGNEYKTQTSTVKNGGSKSCGCLKYYFAKKRIKHGMCDTRIYRVWANIIQRCEDKNATRYQNYGGRGISICKEWRNNFISFYDWAIQNGYDIDKEIDRIDNDGNYEPKNCRFVSESVQSKNTRLICKSNKSGYRGVHFIKKYKIWQSSIMSYGVSTYLGRYKTPLEAAKAYDRYVLDNNLEHTINGVLL